MAFEMASKENFPKFNFTPVSVVGEERKRSDSYYMRMSARDGSAYRPDEDNLKTKEERAITELRSQILSLTKKVFIN